MRSLNTRRSFFHIIIALLVCLPLFAGCRQTGTGTGASSQSAVSATAASAHSSATDTVSSAEASTVTSPDAAGSSAAVGTTAAAGSSRQATSDTSASAQTAPDEHGSYTSKEDVALYLHTYGHLPDNYITKEEARALGWDASAGNLHKVAPGKSIGGDRFGNREGLLPSKKGRQYYECDIDYAGGTRGPKRIVFSDDGLIFYTEDHYASYEQLY